MLSNIGRTKCGGWKWGEMLLTESRKFGSNSFTSPTTANNHTFHFQDDVSLTRPILRLNRSCGKESLRIESEAIDGYSLLFNKLRDLRLAVSLSTVTTTEDGEEIQRGGRDACQGGEHRERLRQGTAEQLQTEDERSDSAAPTVGGSGVLVDVVDKDGIEIGIGVCDVGRLQFMMSDSSDGYNNSRSGQEEQIGTLGDSKNKMIACSLEEGIRGQHANCITSDEGVIDKEVRGTQRQKRSSMRCFLEEECAESGGVCFIISENLREEIDHKFMMKKFFDSEALRITGGWGVDAEDMNTGTGGGNEGEGDGSEKSNCSLMHRENAGGKSSDVLSVDGFGCDEKETADERYCYRMVNGSGDGLCGVVLERFGKNLCVLYLVREGAQRMASVLIKTIQRWTGCQGLLLWKEDGTGLVIGTVWLYVFLLLL
eukprot:GHVQ01023404.1.p1 GENE.GHVQ01023404.1~~GHVQ01023404.1.p1  ORF type:complete len:427 (+),score=91.47 GHVQ01023404.1:509-1789(+)